MVSFYPVKSTGYLCNPVATADHLDDHGDAAAEILQTDPNWKASIASPGCLLTQQSESAYEILNWITLSHLNILLSPNWIALVYCWANEEMAGNYVVNHASVDDREMITDIERDSKCVLSHGVIYRDVQCSNISTEIGDDYPRPIPGDLGLSRVAGKADHTSNACGAPASTATSFRFTK